MRPVELLPRSKALLAFGLLALVTALFLGRTQVVHLCDAGFALLCVLLALPLWWVLFWRARVRRQAFRDFYLLPQSRWHRWIRGGLVMLGGRLLLALTLALFLLIGLARVESPVFWVLLATGALLWPLTYPLVAHRVATQANPRFVRLLATRIHLLSWLSMLLLVLMALAFFIPVPDVRGLSLDEAIWDFTLGEAVRSQVLDWGLVVTQGLQAVPQWLLQNLGDGLPGRILALLAWSMVLMREWLFVWALLLMFQAVQDMLEGGIADRLREAGLVNRS